MIELVQHRMETIRSLCRKYNVRQLEVFGSAADSSAFDPDRSDIDFIISFKSGVDLGPWLTSYFDLQRELEEALGRPVELVMETALRNPLFCREADKTRQVIYAAQDTEAA
jgi:predicted nucleotidyltransferase